VDPPKSKRHEMNTLTKNEIVLALELAKGSVFYPMFHVAIFAGIRRGELIGLTWGDVDLLLSKISIQRSICHTHIGIKKGKPIVKSPKTAKGKRLIPIGDSTVEVLREHYEKQKIFRQSLDLELTDYDYVFCNHFGQPYAPHTISTA
jgi:integrase